MTLGSRMRIRSAMVALLFAMMLFVVAVAPLDAQQGEGNGGGKDRRCRKACEIPEVPITALLPLAAGASVAGYYLVRHYRSRGGQESRPR